MLLALLPPLGKGFLLLLENTPVFFVSYFVGGWLVAIIYFFPAKYFLHKGKRLTAISGEELLKKIKDLMFYICGLLEVTLQWQ